MRQFETMRIKEGGRVYARPERNVMLVLLLKALLLYLFVYLHSSTVFCKAMLKTSRPVYTAKPFSTANPFTQTILFHRQTHLHSRSIHSQGLSTQPTQYTNKPIFTAFSFIQILTIFHISVSIPRYFFEN